jgi:hypothetical protein
MADDTAAPSLTDYTLSVGDEVEILMPLPAEEEDEEDDEEWRLGVILAWNEHTTTFRVKITDDESVEEGVESARLRPLLPLPEGWQATLDAENQQTYYYHAETMETAWERPGTEVWDEAEMEGEWAAEQYGETEGAAEGAGEGADGADGAAEQQQQQQQQQEELLEEMGGGGGEGVGDLGDAMLPSPEMSRGRLGTLGEEGEEAEDKEEEVPQAAAEEPSVQSKAALADMLLSPGTVLTRSIGAELVEETVEEEGEEEEDEAEEAKEEEEEEAAAAAEEEKEKEEEEEVVGDAGEGGEVAPTDASAAGAGNGDGGEAAAAPTPATAVAASAPRPPPAAAGAAKQPGSRRDQVAQLLQARRQQRGKQTRLPVRPGSGSGRGGDAEEVFIPLPPPRRRRGGQRGSASSSDPQLFVTRSSGRAKEKAASSARRRGSMGVVEMKSTAAIAAAAARVLDQQTVYGSGSGSGGGAGGAAARRGSGGSAVGGGSSGSAAVPKRQRRSSDGALALSTKIQHALQGEKGPDKRATRGLVDLVVHTMRGGGANGPAQLVKGHLQNRVRCRRAEKQRRTAAVAALEAEQQEVDDQLQQACEDQDFVLAELLDKKLEALRDAARAQGDAQLTKQAATARGREVHDGVENTLDHVIREECVVRLLYSLAMTSTFSFFC